MLMLLALVLALHLSASADRAPPPARRFRALWNQPWTEACQSHLPLPGSPINISAWTGIESNADKTSVNGSVVGGPAFNGDVIATLYPQDGTGLYPEFDCQGPPFSEKTCKAVNGGSPQLGNLTAHLAKWHADIIHLFPEPASTAVVALDWEMWWPVWENNEPDDNATHYFVYGEVARRLVREKSPQLPPAAVEAQAKAAWEAACQEWLVSTMQLAQKLRPSITVRVAQGRLSALSVSH
jgi:hyaluronoglucosaminidase